MVRALNLIGRVRYFAELHVGVSLLQFSDAGSRACANAYFTRAASAEHFHANNGLAIQQRDGATFRMGVGDGSDAVEAHSAARRQRDAQGGQLLDTTDNTDGTNRLFAFAQSRAPTRYFALHTLQCARHIRGAGAQRTQAHRVNFNAYLTFHTAHTANFRHTLYAEQLLGDGAVDEPRKFAFIELWRFHSISEDGRTGDA